MRGPMEKIRNMLLVLFWIHLLKMPSSKVTDALKKRALGFCREIDVKSILKRKVKCSFRNM